MQFTGRLGALTGSLASYEDLAHMEKTEYVWSLNQHVGVFNNCVENDKHISKEKNH